MSTKDTERERDEGRHCDRAAHECLNGRFARGWCTCGDPSCGGWVTFRAISAVIQRERAAARDAALAESAEKHAQHIDAHRDVAALGMPATAIVRMVAKTFRSTDWLAVLKGKVTP